MAHRLGEAVERLEWLTRAYYLLPLHNTEPELAGVRKRMAELDQEVSEYGELGRGLGHYALGRGHLALHDWERAYTHLKQAEALGIREGGLYFALGRALGEKFNLALENARRSGNKTFVKKRQQELEAELLFPARSYLARSRQRSFSASSSSFSASFLEALIDSYNQDLDSAWRNASLALQAGQRAELLGDIPLAIGSSKNAKSESAIGRRNGDHVPNSFCCPDDRNVKDENCPQRVIISTGL